MANTVTFLIKIDDAGTFKKVDADADALRDAVQAVKNEAEGLNASVLNWAQLSTGISALQDSFGNISSLVSSLTADYAQQEIGEQKLATNMRNTMGARQEDVQSVLDLCSAQQQLGVIGDEVQLAGAQELATYLTKKESLLQLIPVMNDMLAQQYGLEASQENGAQIAAMLGKVMDGQVGALSRYGYKFDEAQEQVLKFGTESERVAVLAEVVESAVGGENAALAQTDSGKQQQLANALGDVREVLGSLARHIQPLLTVGTAALSAAANVGILATSVSALRQHLSITAARTALLEVRTRALNAAQMIFNTVARANPYILLATGIAAVGAAIYALIRRSGALTAAQRQQQQEAERLRQKHEQVAQAVEQAEQEAYSQAASAIRLYTSRLEQLSAKKQAGVNTTRQEKKLVDELNATYGAALGTYGSVSEWYQTLTANSEAYCRQMVLEARTRELANQISLKEQQRHNILFDEKGHVRTYSTENKKHYVATGSNITGTWSTGQYEEMPGTSDMAKAQAAVKELDGEIKSLEAQMAEAAKEADNLFSSIQKGAGTTPTATPGTGNTDKDKKPVENPQTYSELADAINYYEKQLKETLPAEEETIRLLNAQIQTLKQKQTHLEQQWHQAKRPAELDTLQAIDAEIQYQQQLRARSSADDVRTIDLEIERLNALRRAFEEQSNSTLSGGEVKTYAQLEKALSAYEEKLRYATDSERVQIRKQIDDLQQLRREWDETLDAVSAPEDISHLHTTEELEEAISFYSARQRKASAEEIVDIQRTIDQLQLKRDALEQLTKIPSMQRELTELGGLSGKELKLQLELVGLEGIKDKLRELRRMLADTKNPLGRGQQKELRGMIAQWEDYEKQLRKSQLSLRKGWSGMKGIGSGVESITEAVTGQGNAWERVTGVVDGVIGVYDGIQSVIGIIQMLTGVSIAHGAAKTVEATAETAEAGTLAAGATVAVAASTATAGVLGTETAQWSALAAAKTFAAHASIPFVGFAIASGFVGAMEGIIATAAIPKFAEGGIAYGPTLGIFGEYAGAASNPEVVAPLDRLKELIGTPSAALQGKVDFRIKGRYLRGTLQKEQNHSSRT